MKKLLILSNRHSPSDSVVWKAAINNGWKTHRAVYSDDIEAISAGFDVVRYYGDMFHAQYIIKKLPMKFLEIDPKFLAICDTRITKRQISLMKYGELPQPLFATAFIKPFAEKWFEAKIYKMGETIDNGSPKDNDYIYIQETVNFSDEIRCWCLNGKILTASYYRIDKEYYPQPYDFTQNKFINEAVRFIYDNYSNMLPPTVVLDFGLIKRLYKEDEWALIEPNECSFSGTYECDGNEVLKCIIESQQSL